MPQTSVEESMEIGMPGMPADSGFHDVITGINNSKQQIEVTVTLDSTNTTVTINGTAFTELAAVGTKDLIAAALIVQINAGSEPVTARAGSSTDKILIDADESGTGFTYAATANVTIADIILNEASIPFGVFVSLNDAGQQVGDRKLVHLPQLATDVTNPRTAQGFALHTQAVENALSGEGLGYNPQSAVSILKRGRVYVQVEDAVADGGQVFIRHVAGAGEQLGAARSDADGSDASALPNASYVLAANAGELAIVDINLP